MADGARSYQIGNLGNNAVAGVGENIYQVINNFPSAPPAFSYRGIAGMPPPTESNAIQQRTKLVEAIYAKLTQPGINALALTGIGGIGKSTLAALLFRHTETQQLTGNGLFQAPPLWLSIDHAATFADVIGTIFQQLDKPLTGLSHLSPAGQAKALFNLLDTLALPRLIVLDQFDNLLDPTTGEAKVLSTQSDVGRPTKEDLSRELGVGEWIDALNGQAWTSKSRLLLTNRLRPKNTYGYPPTALQEYCVEGLTREEGVALLYTRGIQAVEADLQRAVEKCNGHALSLTLLVALVHDYGQSLASFLTNTEVWQDNIATRLLDAVFSHLNKIQQDLLRALSLYRTPVPIEAAYALLPQVKQTDVLKALRPLLGQHLTQRMAEGQYQLHAIVSDYAKLHFVEDDAEANLQALRQAHTKAGLYYVGQAALSYAPGERRRSVSEMQLLIEAVWQYYQATQWQEAYTLAKQEGMFELLELWGRYADMLELSQLLLPHGKWQPESKDIAKIMYYRASAYESSGKGSQALLLYEYSLGLNKESGNRQGEGDVLSRLGLVYHRSGKKQEALDSYQQALAIYQEVGDRLGEGRLLHRLSGFYDSLGEKQKALDRVQLALQISREVGDRPGEGGALHNLSCIYDSLGEKQKALDRAQLALQVRYEVGDRPGEGDTLHGLGWIYYGLGEMQKALSYYQQALSVRHEVGEPITEGTTLHNIGVIYDTLRKEPEALDYYKQALALYQNSEPDSWPEEAYTLWNIGSLLYRQGRNAPSFAALFLAKQISEKNLGPNPIRIQKWIDALQQRVGNEQFITLRTQVEPQARQILEQALSNGMNNDG